MDPKLIKHLEEKQAAANIGEPESKIPKIGQVEITKCTAITSALNKSLQLAYSNLKPTGKRFMISIDMCSKMNNPCLKAKNVSCLEAALTMTLSILKMEKEVCVVVFNDNKVSPVMLDKGKLNTFAFTT